MREITFAQVLAAYAIVGTVITLGFLVIILRMNTKRAEEPGRLSTRLDSRDEAGGQRDALQNYVIPIAAPSAESFPLHSQLGEAHCWLCDQPTSEVGVLGRARVKGAKIDSHVCKECFGRIEHHVVAPQPTLSVMRRDLSDMEIPARVLPFPESASMMKRGMVS